MSRRASLVAAASLLAACAPPPEAATEYLGALPPVEAPLDGLAHGLARVRERMRARGYDEVTRQGRVFAIEGHPAVLPLDVPTDGCSTFVALGSTAVRDLALTLFDGEGGVLATEDVGGEGGLLHVCPQASSTTLATYLVVAAREGGGSVALAEFRSDERHGGGFEGLFDEVLAPRGPTADIEALLTHSRTTLRARGFVPLLTPPVTSIAEGGSVRSVASLRAGRCYVVVARTAATIEDADLFLFDPAGVEVGRDIRVGSEPVIEHCPEVSGAYAIEARAFAGQGALGIAVVEGPARPAGEEVPLLDVRADASDPSVLLDVGMAPLMQLGFEEPVFVTRGAAISPGESRLHEVLLGPGCALVVASASDDSTDVDLYLADPSGREVDSDTAIRSSAVVRECYAEASVRRVAVKAYGREGSYALAIVRAPSSIGSVEGLRLAEAGAPFRARGFTSRERYDVQLGEGERDMRALEIAAGRCAAMIAGGGEAMRDVDLRVLDASGAAVASDSAPQPFAAASVCAPSDAGLSVVLEVIAYAGGGRASVEVLDDLEVVVP